MNGQLFISLLNPGIGVLLAVAFLMLWMNRRDQRYVAVAAAGYAISALAFLVQDVATVLPFDVQRIAANCLFLLTGNVLCTSILMRHRIRPPYPAMAAVSAVGAAGLIWCVLVEPNIAGRIFFISFALGIITLVTVRKLYPVKKEHLIDRLLFWVVALSAANFIFRPILILWLIGGYETYEGFQQSVYWSTVQFSQALISIMIALNLMVAVAIDLMAELKQEANTDQLSGLLNRRGFEAEAGRALKNAVDAGLPVSLMIADLDRFKWVNDTYGHAAGDTVIAAFGECVRTLAGEHAVAGRIGGEEFAVLLPGAMLSVARETSERIRKSLAEQCAGRVPFELVPTVSIGLCLARSGSDLYALLSDADQALYRAKDAGRNRVQVFIPDYALKGVARGGFRLEHVR